LFSIFHLNSYMNSILFAIISIMLFQSKFGILTIVSLFFLNSYFMLDYLYICKLHSK
jgi:hypothetical protein